MLRTLISLVVCLGMPAGSWARAQQECRAWGSEFSPPDLDGPAYSTIEHDDGSGPSLFVAGQFTMAGGVPARGIAKWNGSAWIPLATGMLGTAAAGTNSLAVFDEDGPGGNPAQLFVAGSFAVPGHPEIQGIARWNGSQWSAVSGGGLLAGAGVNALAVFDEDGAGLGGPALFAAGDFRPNGLPGSLIARWNGSVWSSVGGGLTGTSASALAVHNDGSGPALFVGGTFSSADGITAMNMARWNGTAWTGLGGGLLAISINGAFSRVTAMASFEGRLYVSGLFDTAGDQPASCIAAWTGQSWLPVGGGLDRPALTMQPFFDGVRTDLYIGGDFTTADGAVAERITRWTGTAYSPLNPGANGIVSALRFYESGSGPSLLVFGGFSIVGGVRSPLVAQWSGAVWSARGNPVQNFVSPGNIFAMTDFDADGDGPLPPALFLAGGFNRAGDLSTTNIATWDGGRFAALPGTALTENSTPRALQVADLGQGEALYIGTDASLARFDGQGTTASLGGRFIGFPSESVYINGLAAYDDGRGNAIYAAGDFLGIARQTTPRVAKLTNGAWNALGAGLPLTIVHALTVFDNGAGQGEQVFAAGTFVSPNPAFRNMPIWRWDGSVWSTVGPAFSNFGGEPLMRSLAVFNGGSGPNLYVGGVFRLPTRPDGSACQNVARFDGTNWVDVGDGTPSRINKLVVFDDGVHGPQLYAGGLFGVMRFESNSWQALPNGITSNVNDMVVWDDDGAGPQRPKLYVTGTFVAAGSMTVNHIARWDGSAWTALGSGLAGLPATGGTSLVGYNDSTTGSALYVGGRFSSAGGVTAWRVARWDGAQWSALGSGIATSNTTDSNFVNTIAISDPDGAGSEQPALYAGGTFVSAGGMTVSRLAKWDGSEWTDVPGADGEIRALLPTALGGVPEMFICGRFVEGDVLSLNNIGRFDGNQWEKVGHGTNESIQSLVAWDVDGAGPLPRQVYAGGDFTQSGASALNRIASWNGSTWSALGAGMNDSVVYFEALDGEPGMPGSLHCSGRFTTAGGSVANHVAEWDGTAWSAVGSAPNSSVGPLRRYQDDEGFTLYAVGVFTFPGSPAVSQLARFAGGEWQPLAGGGAVSVASALMVSNVGTGPSLFVSGPFSVAGGKQNVGLARYGPCPPASRTPPCAADFNLDGLLDPDDLADYIGAYFSVPPNPNADYNLDGLTDPDDLADFIGAFFGGCP